MCFFFVFSRILACGSSWSREPRFPKLSHSQKWREVSSKASHWSTPKVCLCFRWEGSPCFQTFRALRIMSVRSSWATSSERELFSVVQPSEWPAFKQGGMGGLTSQQCMVLYLGSYASPVGSSVAQPFPGVGWPKFLGATQHKRSFVLAQECLGLWCAVPARRPEKSSNQKVTQKWVLAVGQRNQKATQKWLKQGKRSLCTHFWVTLCWLLWADHQNSLLNDFLGHLILFRVSDLLAGTGTWQALGSPVLGSPS